MYKIGLTDGIIETDHRQKAMEQGICSRTSGHPVDFEHGCLNLPGERPHRPASREHSEKTHKNRIDY